MVECFPIGRVVYAGYFHQDLLQAPGKCLGVPRHEVFHSRHQIRRRPSRAQSAQDLIAIDAADFSIGDGQHVDPRVDDEAAGDNLEIACQQQDGVECVWVVGKLWVNRVLREDCCHRLPLDEAQQIVLLDGIGLLEQLAQQSISRGMCPVGLRLALLFEEAEHRPWIVDFLLAEAVAIVPVVKNRQGRLLLLFMSQGAHFFWREADPIGIRPVDDAADLEVVEAAEDALFGNAQDTGEDGEIQELVLL